MFGEVRTVHELHDKEGNALGLFDGVDRHDVDVVERGNGPCLALETHATVAIGREVAWQDLQSNLAS